MKQSTTSNHIDWEIRTVVGIDNPDDWEPGNPDRFYVRGIAEVRPDGDRFGYTSNEPLIVTTEHFDDERLARRYHGEATIKLQEMINRLLIK